MNNGYTVGPNTQNRGFFGNIFHSAANDVLNWFRPHADLPVVGSYQPTPTGGTITPYADLPAAPQTLGQISGGPTAVGTAGGSTGTSSGTTGTYDANTDPTLVAQARSQVSPLLDQLNNLYNSLGGQLDAYAQDQKGQVDQNYNDVTGQNTKAYQQGVDQTNAGFTANNAYDSSYRGNAVDNLTGAYNDAQKTAATNRDNAYAGIGSVVAQDKQALSDKPSYDLSQYNDVNSLLGLRDALDTHINNLQQQQNQLLTQGQLKQQLAQAAPTQSSALAQQIQQKIAEVAGSNADPAAKYGIASNYITNSGLSDDDKNKLTNYLTSLLKDNNTATTAKVAAVGA